MSAAPYPAKGPPARALPRLRWRSAGLLLAAFLSLAPTVRADDDVPRDLLLTVAARRALFGDGKLARLGVGVSVRQGMAMLWGSSPSTELTAQAVERLRHVPGLVGVRSEVLPAPQAEAELGPPDESDNPDPVVPRALQPAPTALAGRIGPPGRVPALPSAGSSATPPDAAVSLAGPVLGATAPPPAGHRPAAELGRPIPRAVLSAGPPPRSPPPDLASAVEHLCHSDARFTQLRPEVQGGVVSLHGSVRRGEDLSTFAGLVAGLAGVERVVVDRVEVVPGP
jgi:hypothetical protein